MQYWVNLLGYFPSLKSWTWREFRLKHSNTEQSAGEFDWAACGCQCLSADCSFWRWIWIQTSTKNKSKKIKSLEHWCLWLQVEINTDSISDLNSNKQEADLSVDNRADVSVRLQPAVRSRCWTQYLTDHLLQIKDHEACHDLWHTNGDYCPII